MQLQEFINLVATRMYLVSGVELFAPRNPQSFLANRGSSLMVEHYLVKVVDEGPTPFFPAHENQLVVALHVP